jgi:hypothetical protein
MKKILSAVILFLFFAGISLAQHGHNAKPVMGQGASHRGVPVFKGEKNGVKVDGRLNDLKSAMEMMMKDSGMKLDMSKMDPNLTHHIFFMISGNATTGEIKGATLRLSLRDNVSDYTLMPMNGHFGADISIKEKEKYDAMLVVYTEKVGQVEFNFPIKN